MSHRHPTLGREVRRFGEEMLESESGREGVDKGVWYMEGAASARTRQWGSFRSEIQHEGSRRQAGEDCSPTGVKWFGQ